MKKTINDFEIERNIIAIDRKKYPADKVVSVQEFDAIISENYKEFTGCNHADRTQFLIDNGYVLTHENMLNSDLSANLVETDQSV